MQFLALLMYLARNLFRPSGLDYFKFAAKALTASSRFDSQVETWYDICLLLFGT